MSDTFRYMKKGIWCRRNWLTKGKIGTITIKENERLSRALACSESHMVKGQKREKLGCVYPSGQEKQGKDRNSYYIYWGRNPYFIEELIIQRGLWEKGNGICCLLSSFLLSYLFNKKACCFSGGRDWGNFSSLFWWQYQAAGFGGGGNQRWRRTKGKGQVEMTEEGCFCAAQGEWIQMWGTAALGNTIFFSLGVCLS